MGPIDAFLAGIAPEHGPALLALLLAPLAIWVGLPWLFPPRRGETSVSRLLERWRTVSFARRTLASLLLVTAVVHLALPLGHRGTPILNVLFVAAGAAFAVVSIQSLGEGHRPWRSALLLISSIVAYLVVAGSGWLEEADQVGIATKLVELAALALVMVPAPSTVRSTGLCRLTRPAASAAVVGLTFVTGAVIWVGMFVAHSGHDVDASQVHIETPGTPPHVHAGSGHHHSFAARAQAGLIMRPSSGEPPTLEEADAANRLAEASRVASARFDEFDAALAAGYSPDGPELGLQRHLTNKDFQRDGRLLDPERPEQLVFATVGQRTRLLGVVYQMEAAGEPGPAVGGSITNWHAHNVCLALLPPSFGIVSPFGSCPLGAVGITIAEMMHVWVVDNPGGPFAEDLDDGWVRKLLESEAESAGQ